MERGGDAPGEAARNVNGGVAERTAWPRRRHSYTRVQRRNEETGGIPGPQTEPDMDQMLATLPDRAMRVAHQVGGSLKGAVPDRALHWMETGAALAAVKTGSRAAAKVVRRNPALVATAVAGAGLLWLVARQRRKRMEEAEAANEGNGKPKRVRARKASKKRDA